MDGLGLYLKDLYPNFAGLDTTAETIPEAEDKDALHEDMEQAEKVSVKESSKKNILLALAVMAGLVIFFGSSK